MIKEMRTGVYTRNNEVYDFNFKTSLPAYDKLVFVKTVVETLVDDNSYGFIVKDLIFDFAIVKVFTDVNTSFINIKDDEGNIVNPIIPIEQFLEETNIVDIVKANMEVGLLEELNKAVDLNIQYLTGIRPSPLSDAIASILFTLEKKISEIDTDSMMSMAQKFASMTGEFTPESIVSAYMNSDIHKKNLDEIEEANKRKAEFAKDMDKAISSVGKKSKK